MTEEERKINPKEKEDECKKTRQRKMRQRFFLETLVYLFLSRVRCNKE
jgi:hypothetical protein